MTVIDSRGSIRLSTSGGKVLADVGGKSLILHSYIVNVDGKEWWDFTSSSGTRRDWPAPTSWDDVGYFAESKDGVGVLLMASRSPYPDKFSSSQPSDNKYSYYVALTFSLEDGRINGEYGIDANGSVALDNTTGPGGTSFLVTGVWGSPDDYTTGSYHQAESYFDFVLNPTTSFAEIDSSGSRSLLIAASTWSETISINRELTGTSSSGILQAKQVEKDNWTGPTGSLITGNSGNDIIRGLAGWDILDGGAGDDLIHGGNGRDVITGGTGSDELHGDFGWNTYKDQRDGSVDLIAIKSDQFLNNWWYGKAGNSPNGEKSDIIEGLDSTDQIKIIGVATSDLSFRDGISHKGVTGIGIYATGVLEALYTGGDLSVSQISSMTTGDNSAQAMANQLWSYWGDNTVPALLD